MTDGRNYEKVSDTGRKEKFAHSGRRQDITIAEKENPAIREDFAIEESHAIEESPVIKEYAAEVCRQIRWKKARRLVEREIQDHICDQRDAYLASGMNEGEAEVKAVESMGDPVAVGMSLDRVHRPKPQHFMIVIASVMLAAGAVMRHLTGAVINDVSGYSLRSNLLGAFLAWGVFLVVYFVDFSWLKEHAGKFFAAFVSFSALLKFSSIYCSLGSLGPEDGGLRLLWENIFGYPFFEGVRECLPLIYPVVFALVVYRMRGRGMKGIFLCEMAFLLMMCSFCSGSAAMFWLFLTAAACTICYAAWQDWFLAGRGIGMTAAALPFLTGNFGLIFRMKSVSEGSIEMFGGMISVPNLFAEEGLIAEAYNLKTEAVQAMISGSVFSGRGSLSAEDSYLLGAESSGNGQMLTTLTYHCGWIAFFAVAALFVLFLAAGIFLCRKQKSPMVRLLSVSVLATLTVQTVIYLLGNLGVAFSISAALPLMSGASVVLMSDAVLAGLMLSMFRTEEVYRDCLA